jgi:hypothetical protein
VRGSGAAPRARRRRGATAGACEGSTASGASKATAAAGAGRLGGDGGAAGSQQVAGAETSHAAPSASLTPSVQHACRSGIAKQTLTDANSVPTSTSNAAPIESAQRARD